MANSFFSDKIPGPGALPGRSGETPAAGVLESVLSGKSPGQVQALARLLQARSELTGMLRRKQGRSSDVFTERGGYDQSIGFGIKE